MFALCRTAKPVGFLPGHEHELAALMLGYLYRLALRLVVVEQAEFALEFQDAHCWHGEILR